MSSADTQHQISVVAVKLYGCCFFMLFSLNAALCGGCFLAAQWSFLGLVELRRHPSVDTDCSYCIVEMPPNGFILAHHKKRREETVNSIA